jgi:hypothetical protein
VATSAEGGPAFYPLDEKLILHPTARAGEVGARRCARRGLAERSQPRISW